MQKINGKMQLDANLPMVTQIDAKMTIYLYQNVRAMVK